MPKKPKKTKGDKLPAVVTLTSAHATTARHLKTLMDAAEVVCGLLNATIHQTNSVFWDEARATYDIDTEAFHWSVENGKLVPRPKPESPFPTAPIVPGA